MGAEVVDGMVPLTVEEHGHEPSGHLARLGGARRNLTDTCDGMKTDGGSRIEISIGHGEHRRAGDVCTAKKTSVQKRWPCGTDTPVLLRLL